LGGKAFSTSSLKFTFSPNLEKFYKKTSYIKLSVSLPILEACETPSQM
jgi:hypothetical protein